MRTPAYGFELFDHCATCNWKEDGFFCSFGPDTLQSFEAITFTNVYPEGAVLFAEGQSPRGIFMLCHGRAKLSISSGEGKTLITRIVEPGEALGLASSLSGNAYKTTAETLEPSQVNFVRREDLVRFIASHHDACSSVATQLTRECESEADHIRTIELSHSAAEKLAGLILSWCTERGRVVEGGTRVQMLMTHEDMSQLIGTSRETVTRLLRDFRDKKLISINGSALVVHNRTALESLVLA